MSGRIDLDNVVLAAPLQLHSMFLIGVVPEAASLAHERGPLYLTSRPAPRRHHPPFGAYAGPAHMR